jgi:hypothetical protein
MNGPAAVLEYPNGTPAVANDAGRYLATEAKQPTGSWRALEPSEAQDLANQGTVVIGVQRNTGQDANGNPNHGHIVTVRPELIPGEAESLGQGPIVNNIGRTRTVQPAQSVFEKDGGPVLYYGPSRR